MDEDLFGDPGDNKKVEPAKAKPQTKSKRRSKKRKSRRRRRRKKFGQALREPWTLTAQEHTTAAQRLAMKVAPGSTFGPRAKFLEGVLLYKTGRPNDALKAFKAVVRETRGRSNAEKLRQMAFFQLARTHFGAEQPSFSIFYYDKIDRDAYAWLDALYEGSWAEFGWATTKKRWAIF